MKPNTKKILAFTLPALGVVVLASSIAAIVATGNHTKINHNKIEQKQDLKKPKISFNNTNYSFNIETNKNKSIPLNVENIHDSNSISYFITSGELKLNNFLISKGSPNFNIPHSLIEYVNKSPEGYLSFYLTAKYKDVDQIIETKPTIVTLFRVTNLKPNSMNSKLLPTNSVANLFCLPGNSVTKQFNIGSNINLKLLSGLDDQKNVKQWQIVRLANDAYNKTTSIINNVTPTVDPQTSEKEFSYKVLPGWQQIVIKAIGNNNQVLAVSNTINLEGVQTMKMSLTSPNLNLGLVSIGKETSTTLNFHTNISNFELNNSNIYYQNSTTNNQWVSLANKTPTNFHVEIKDDKLDITHMTGNYATNFKVIDQVHQITSNIVTVSSYVSPSVYQPKIQINGQNLTNNQIVFDKKPQTVNLINTNDYNSSLLTKTWYVVNSEGKWQEIGQGDSVNYNLTQDGSYRFKLSLQWKNLISSPSYDQTFNVIIKNNDTTQILNEKNTLDNWVKNPENLKNTIIKYFSKNPEWLIDYMSTWGHGYKLTLNSSNVKEILGNPQILVDEKNNNQLILKTDILSTLQAQQYRGNNTLKFEAGNTLYVGLPFYLQKTKGYSITPSVDEAGYSWLNISINPKQMNSNKQLAWYVCKANTNQVLRSVKINLSVLPKSCLAPININHYQDNSIPQTIENLAPLFNLD